MSQHGVVWCLGRNGFADPGPLARGEEPRLEVVEGEAHDSARSTAERGTVTLHCEFAPLSSITPAEETVDASGKPQHALVHIAGASTTLVTGGSFVLGGVAASELEVSIRSSGFKDVARKGPPGTSDLGTIVLEPQAK